MYICNRNLENVIYVVKFTLEDLLCSEATLLNKNLKNISFCF